MLIVTSDMRETQRLSRARGACCSGTHVAGRQAPDPRDDKTPHDADGSKSEGREGALGDWGHGRVFNLFKQKTTEHGSEVYVPFCRSNGLGTRWLSCALHSRSSWMRVGEGV